MSLRDDIITQMAALQIQLDILNQVPSDVFNLGTVVVFAAGTGGSVKWYYSKIAEEAWKDIKNSEVRDLANWILLARESNIGYFEVYVMEAQEVPFYASA